MKKLWDPIIETSQDLQKAAEKLANDGVAFFKGQLGSIRLFSSSSAIQTQDTDRDETHYFLVPNHSETSGYSLYIVRALPDGVGPENDLPKAKIFQLPAAGTSEHLIDLLLGEIKSEKMKETTPDSPLADRLELISEEIDKQCNLVSGGLLLVGGIVAIANPLLGVGIAAKSLLPGLGNKISTHGIKHASDWFRKRAEDKAESDIEKSSRSQVKNFEPEIRINPVLSLLEKTIHSTSDFDPSFESLKYFSDHREMSDAKLGARAISSVYQDVKIGDHRTKTWVESLRDW